MTALSLTVTRVQALTPQVKLFRFEAATPLPLFSGGAHIVVEMPDGDVLRRNSYSLISDPHDPSGYEIAVRLDPQGRGGSRFLHEKVREGDRLRVSMPANLFAIDPRAKRHLLIAGGIGITPFLAQIRQLDRLNLDWALHYAAPSRKEAAALGLLPRSSRISLHFSDEGNRMDLATLLDGQPAGTHVFCCGPEGLITAVEATAARLGWPQSHLHSEAFAAPPPGAAFSVTLGRSGRTLTVGPHQSLLEAIEAADVPIDWSCRGGACGRCETAVRACHGRILHHDHWLSEDERAAQTKIMPCMSRFLGEDLTLDL
ncbi:PDR/VanB family oxidoreductase [Thioclava sp. GXIMD4216]|uniref:PDR/VanB family oxidoreductase n=1 Tax=Thioclava sp. GXIMD4216 TaxID=3131929 RepID=UPI0030CED5AD